MRREVVLRHGWVLAFYAMGWGGTFGYAQDYPSRPVRFIVPYPPGGSVDFTARLVASRLAESLGHSVVIDNRGGGGGIIAGDLAAHAPADGHTLFFATPAAMCVAPAMQVKAPYDSNRDFAPITRLVVNSQILVAIPSFAPNSVQELIQLAKARPGQVLYASAGLGTSQHLGIELLRAKAGVEMTHVPYKGGGPAMTDLLAGRVQLFMASIPGLLPLIKAGKLKVLGVAGIERSEALPGVPLISESLPGYEFVGTWYGMFTQSRVGAPIINRLNSALSQILQAPDIRQKLVAQGSDPRPMPVKDFATFVRTDCAAWVRAVKLAGIKPE